MILQPATVALLVASAASGMAAVFFDRRLLWMASILALVAMGVMFVPDYRGLWIVVGGFGAFASSGFIWREVEQGEHPSQRLGAGDRRSTAASSGSPK